MAYRGYLDDLEHEQEVMHYYMSGMVGIMRSNGADRVSNPPKPRQLRRKPQMNVIQDLETVLASLGGTGTVLENKSNGKGKED